MANFSALEEDFCEEYLTLQYADLGKCTDLCQLYSDGRCEGGGRVHRTRPRPMPVCVEPPLPGEETAVRGAPLW
jgi:hypothetical protein